MTFTSSNYSIAKIDSGSDYERLWIIPVSVGTAMIEVTTADGGYTDTITVHVVEEGSGTSSGSTSKRLACGDDFEIGKITYVVLRDTTTVAVSKADKDIETANINKYVKYDGVSYKVTGIGNDAFRGCTGLTSITILNSVTSIGDWAFERCTGLTSITIPDSVKSIGSKAFYGCTDLSHVYYFGTKAQLKNIKVDYSNSGNDALKKAIIHCSDGTIVGNHTHSYTGEITKQPTCTKEGVMTYTCDCGDTYTEAIPAKGHTWNTGEETKSPTCIEDGVKTYTCADCGETKTEVIPATGHSFVNKTVAPTYDAQGYTEHTCSACGYSYKDSYTPKKQRKSISGATISISGKQYVYTGKALKPSFTVKLNGVTLKGGTDYTATFKSNTNCGQASLTVTGKGAYTGSKTANFIIKPSKAVLSKVTSPKTKQIKVVWKKSAGGVSGYEIMTATDKSFKKNKKTTTITSGSTTSKTITKLKAKTKYFVKIRAYKTVGKTKYYGAWSAVKKVKTK